MNPHAAPLNLHRSLSLGEAQFGGANPAFSHDNERVHRVFPVFLGFVFVDLLLKLCDSPRRPVQGSADGLLGDYAAGDAVSSISCGIRFHVVRFGMDHERRAAVTEKGMIVIAQVHVGIRCLEFGLAIGFHGKILHVAGVVAFRILQTVLFPVGIEVRASRLKVRRIAFSVLMKMQRVLARRQIVEVKLERHASSGLAIRDDGGADALTLSIFQVDHGFRRARKREGEYS
jgi:hypothetical protein